MKANKTPPSQKGTTDKDLDFNFAAIARAKPLTREEEAAIGLPSPEELVKKTPGTKITLAIDNDALDFFKSEARRLNTSYQGMMRALLSAYVAQIRSQRTLHPVRKATRKKATASNKDVLT